MSSMTFLLVNRTGNDDDDDDDDMIFDGDFPN